MAAGTRRGSGAAGYRGASGRLLRRAGEMLGADVGRATGTAGQQGDTARALCSHVSAADIKDTVFTLYRVGLSCVCLSKVTLS